MLLMLLGGVRLRVRAFPNRTYVEREAARFYAEKGRVTFQATKG